MLQIENLSKSYAGLLLFDGVSFSLQKGEKCALVGRNGSGKTTLFRILKGEESADSGSILLPKGYKLGFLDQHLEFKAPTVWEEALRDLPPEKPEYEVESILFGLGFDKELLEKPPEVLSGGYHLRLKLAKVLSQQPDCLLLDEPTNYLDIVSLRWLERYLKNWRKECIFISHDRDFLNGLVSHTMGFHRKCLKKVAGGLEEFYQKIVEEEEIYEKTRQSIEKKKEHLEDYIRRFGAKASKATQAQSKAKALEKIPSLTKLAALENLSFHFEYSPFSGKKMISLDHADFHYQEDKPLIQGVSCDIEKGQKIAIIGKNGMGKSTLLQLISGDISPTKGSYSCSSSLKKGIFGQTHILKLDLDQTIEEAISSANRNLPYAKVRAICGQMLFSQDAAKKRISLLSGGERSRVLLGQILATPTNILLLDEPTHHLDLESIEGLMEALESYEGAIVLVTHSEWMLERMNPDLLIVFDENRQKVFLGNYEEFLEKEGWQEPSLKKAKPKQAPVKNKEPSTSSLEKEIERMEASIETLETKNKQLETKLALVYEEPTAKEIAALHQEIEKLYQNLEKKYQELASCKKT
jgi:ATP-binding cassette, subfamily F, member 3